VHVAAGERAEAPVHVVHLRTSGAEGELPAAFPRLLVVLEAGASATVVEHHAALDPDAPGGYLAVPVTEVLLQDGAELSHVKVQDEGGAAVHLATLQARQAGPSTFATHAIDLGGHLVRNYAGVEIAAEGCETRLYGAYVVTGDDHVDNHTRLDHARAGCHSVERYKGILDDRATAVFTGRIKVHQDAQQTDAVQENSAVLLSRDAMVSTQPQLEIFADDVKCTHGATVGELAADQLLYLRARGIPAAEARALLTFAFANEVVELAPEAVRGLLEDRVRARLAATTHAAG
jgi:Fe-S cluster assembly protein SufD